MSPDERSVIAEIQKQKQKVQHMNDVQIEQLRENLKLVRSEVEDVISNKELAAVIGVDPKTVNNFFTGVGKPDLKTVLGLTHALGWALTDVAKAPADFRKLKAKGK